MEARKSNIVKFPRKPKANGDHMLGCVTLGTKEIVVIQEDGKAPPYAWVQSSRVWNRDPTVNDEQHRTRRALALAAKPTIQSHRPGWKWCAGECGEWRMVNRFTAKADASDGLHPYCNQCRADHARRMYAAKRDAAAALLNAA